MNWDAVRGTTPTGGADVGVDLVGGGRVEMGDCGEDLTKDLPNRTPPMDLGSKAAVPCEECGAVGEEHAEGCTVGAPAEADDENGDSGSNAGTEGLAEAADAAHEEPELNPGDMFGAGDGGAL